MQAKSLSDFKHYAGVKFIYSKKMTGKTFSHINGIEDIAAIPGFHRFALLYQPNMTIKPFTDFRSRIAEVVFTGATYEEVKNKLTLADSLLKIKTIGQS